ncbi:unnamed protein product [Strongylus vulgaris]|uniref:Uncharacterized protein n=1 Tax=Strongylus vulgaris TaxID=40348 RepID=A0A3P7KWL4_STRVU|nr:unnamed protein product [Strongylus vulgaris]
MWNRVMETSVLRSNSSLHSASLALSSNSSQDGVQNLRDDRESRGGNVSRTSTSADQFQKEGFGSKILGESVKLASPTSANRQRDDVQKTSIPNVNIERRCEYRPTPSRPEAADEVIGLRKKSSRIFALKSMENTPVRKVHSEAYHLISSSLNSSKDDKGDSQENRAAEVSSPCKGNMSEEITTCFSSRSSSDRKTLRKPSHISPSMASYFLRKRKFETPEASRTIKTTASDDQRTKQPKKDANNTTPKIAALSTPSHNDKNTIGGAVSSVKKNKRPASSTPRRSASRVSTKSALNSASKSDSIKRRNSSKKPIPV